MCRRGPLTSAICTYAARQLPVGDVTDDAGPSACRSRRLYLSIHINEWQGSGAARGSLNVGKWVLASAAWSYTANRAAFFVKEGNRSGTGGLNTQHKALPPVGIAKR